MSGYQAGILLLAVLTIIFNAGGFVWLARNHMRHVQSSIDSLTDRVVAMEKAIARIEGYCQARHNLD